MVCNISWSNCLQEAKLCAVGEATYHRIKISPFIDEEAGQLEVVPEDGLVQGRHAVVVAQVGVGALLQQQPSNFYVSLNKRCSAYKGAKLKVVKKKDFTNH